MSSLAALTAALAFTLASQDPTAQPPQDSEVGTEIAPIVVEGRVEERVNAFIDEVAAAPPGRRLARWDRSICVGAANMRASFAQALIDHVSRVALETGLDIGEPGCSADVLIVASDEASTLAAELIDDNPLGFRPARGATDLGSEALETFQTTDAPVRWWHVSLPVSVDTGEVAIRLAGEPDTPTLRVRDASRLRSNIREDLARVIIILDIPKLQGVSLRALGDYVSMVALAQIDPAGDVSGYDSVLNLFAGGTADGMTSWDRDYLTSLYAARRDRARVSQQQRDIAEGMLDPDNGDEGE